MEWPRQSSADRSCYAALGYEAIERGTGSGGRPQLSDRHVAIGHDQSLTAFYKTQIAAEILAQLRDANAVAHVHQSSR
jgi:hypothetical protein